MRFVGVDLAWTESGGSGVCVVEDDQVRDSGSLGGDEELLAWLEPHLQGDALVAIDAPLIVRNETGRRPCEQAISRCFGAYHAAAHSSNLGLPAFRGGVRGERVAAALGLGVDPAFPSQAPVMRAIEVYPHTAIVALFGLATTLKYKAKSGRTLASRSAELRELLRLLESLADADPPLDVAAAPRWDELRGVVETPRSGAALECAEDEIDAYVCAYTALYYWTHGISRCRVVGDTTDGYIVTPVTPELGACLDRLAAAKAGALPPRRPAAPETRPVDLSEWPPERIERECAEPYRRYHASVRRRHIEYFEERPELRDPERAFCAKSLADALPPGWGERLERLIPPEKRHRWHLSAGSSQTLGLGLLGPAALLSRRLEWLFHPDGPFPAVGQPVGWQFEYEVGFGLLNERPSTTDVDFLLSGPSGAVALEAKFTEEGWGRCRCKGRAEGRCDKRIHHRPYWKAARDVFGLDGPDPPRPCQLSLVYQAVRNVAAVLEMTGLRDVGAFGLLYDARNPYFAGVEGGEWPGWAAWLRSGGSVDGTLVLRALSWQELVPLLPRRGRREVLRWAAEKHGLP